MHCFHYWHLLSLAPSGATFIKNREIGFDVPTRPREDEEQDEDDNLGPRYEYYQSEKINGVLFDAIDEQKIWYQQIQRQTKTDITVWTDIFRHIVRECKRKLVGIYWENLRDEALEIRRK